MIIYKFDEKQYELAKRYIPGCYEGRYELIFDDSNHSVMVQDIDIEEFQTSADEAIIEFGMVDQDYLTQLGRELQWLFDEIYYQTVKGLGD